MMLYRLLSPLDPASYCLISSGDHVPDTAEEGASTRLAARTHFLGAHPSSNRLPRVLAPVLRPTQLGVRVLARARRFARIVKDERCEAILACSGDLIDMPAAFLASRWTHKPLYAYMFDDYRYQWPHPLHRRVARTVERVVAGRLAGLIVPNELLAAEYFNRHGLRATVIYNASDTTEELERQDELPWPAQEGSISIVYTGAVYHAQLDAFRNLVRALADPAMSQVRLHLYTSQQPDALEREGISGPVLFHPHLTHAATRAVQRRADILFLPLSFETIPHVIRTSAPAKMAEYLSSARPVIVHAPPDSFVAEYFTKNGCGLVVEKADSTRLAVEIGRIIDSADLRASVVTQARACARKDFDLAEARRRFVAIFEPTPRESAQSVSER